MGIAGGVLHLLTRVSSPESDPADVHSGRREPFMRSSRSPRGGSPSALPALLRATHLFGLALENESGGTGPGTRTENAGESLVPARRHGYYERVFAHDGG